MNISEITKQSGKVKVNGWVHDFRDIGALKFIQLRDSTGVIQVTVLRDSADPKIIEEIKGLPKESVLEIEGMVQENAKVQSGMEIIPETLHVMVRSKPELPISVSEKGVTTGLAKRLDYRCLDLRKLKTQAIFKVQSAILEGMQRYLLNDGFIQVFTPCIMGVASESGSEVFPIIYFDKEAFLRQDPQLHRQLTIAGGFPKIFDIGPAWRAEQSHTVKHLCEHRVCAVETAFIKDEYDIIRLEEQVIIAALNNVKDKCQKELDTLGVKMTVPKAPFPVITFPELYEILEKKGKELPEDTDLDADADRILWEHVKEKYNSEFYFVNWFPSKIKPFYVMKRDEDPRWARSIDLNYKGMELSSGGQREHRHEKIMQAVKEKGMKESEVHWFTQFFEFGVPPHGGFAIGIERITQKLLDIENIRECVLFPRDTERLVP
jgi:nondiscriminating aspartyl-tRNA synthetase